MRTFTLIVVSIFMILLPLSGQEKDSVSVRQKVLYEARYLKSIYKTDQAIERLSVLVSPTLDEEVLSELAECHALNGDVKSALGTYSMLAAYRPGKIPYKVKKMQLQARMKDYPSAVETGKAILAIDSIPAIVSLMGDYFALGGEKDSTYTYAATAYRMLPDNPIVVNKFTKQLLDRKEYDRAIDVTERYLEEDPDNMDIAPVCALAYYLKGDYYKSADILHRQVDLGNDTYGVHLYLAHSLWQIEDPITACVEFKRAWQIDSTDATIAYSIGALETGNNKDAIGWLDKAETMVTPDPKFIAKIHHQKGAYYGMKREFAKSIAEYRKAYEYDSSIISALSSIGYAYEQLKDWKNALLWYERYLKVGKPGTRGYDFVQESIDYIKQVEFMDELRD